MNNALVFVSYSRKEFYLTESLWDSNPRPTHSPSPEPIWGMSWAGVWPSSSRLAWFYLRDSYGAAQRPPRRIKDKDI